MEGAERGIDGPVLFPALKGEQGVGGLLGQVAAFEQELLQEGVGHESSGL